MRSLQMERDEKIIAVDIILYFGKMVIPGREGKNSRMK